MRILKLFAIGACFMVFLPVAVVAHALVAVIKPASRWAVIDQLTYVLIRVIQLIIGIQIDVTGSLSLPRERGYCVICRHVGYIDGLVIGGLFPGSFISKKEVQSWPLIGQVVAISGTVFIDRQRAGRLFESLKVIEERLRSGLNVFLFPEGTSTDGTALHPFQTAFFRAPIAANASVVPLTIEYVRIDDAPVTPRVRDSLFWYGDMGFFSHFWNLLRFRSIAVRVIVHEPVETIECRDNSLGRKALSQRCRLVIAEAADIPFAQPRGRAIIKASAEGE